MTPRTAKILQSVIQQFIETGEPVSSKQVAKCRDFGVREATLRNELNMLMNEGFLAQPHISGGRIPTDKGYRFLVQTIMEEAIEDARLATGQITRNLKEEMNQGNFDGLVDDLSDELEVLTVGYSMPEKHVYKSGLGELFSHLISTHWFNDPNETFRIIQDFEMIDEKIHNLLNFMDESPKVFIGKSPITKSRQLSVIADRYDFDGVRFVLAAVGPKQMDYGRNIRFFRELKESINE